MNVWHFCFKFEQCIKYLVACVVNTSWFPTVNWCHVMKPDCARLLPTSFHLSVGIAWCAINLCVHVCAWEFVDDLLANKSPSSLCSGLSVFKLVEIRRSTSWMDAAIFPEASSWMLYITTPVQRMSNQFNLRCLVRDIRNQCSCPLQSIG